MTTTIELPIYLTHKTIENLNIHDPYPLTKHWKYTYEFAFEQAYGSEKPYVNYEIEGLFKIIRDINNIHERFIGNEIFDKLPQRPSSKVVGKITISFEDYTPVQECYPPPLGSLSFLI